MNQHNLAFVRYIETDAKTNPLFQGEPYRIALERARKSATMDLLDGHIKYDEESGRFVQPEDHTSCIRCRWPESTWARGIGE